MDVDDPREILVRAPNWVGDIVMATPGLRALRAGFPAARITVQTRPGHEALLSGCPSVDEIIPVSSYHQGPVAMWREARVMARKKTIDLGLCIPDSFSSAALMRIAAVKKVVGYAGGVRAPLIHCGVPVPVEWGKRKMVARESFVLGLVEALGCEARGTHLELFTSSEEESRVDDVLSKHAIDGETPIVVLAPGASFGPSKCWPVNSFAEVGDAMHARGARVVVLGAPSEQGIAAEISRLMNEPVVDLSGAFSLGEAKALIRRSKLVVCNDAGARHIATAFAIPSIVLFGPTSLEKTNLNLDSVTVLETDDACRPCYKRICPIDHRCMTGISPNTVIQHAESTLGVRT